MNNNHEEQAVFIDFDGHKDEEKAAAFIAAVRKEEQS